MALTALTMSFLAFVSEVASEHCPAAGISDWMLNSTLGHLYAPFDCPKPEDPSANIYCCGFSSFRFCCPEKCGRYAFSCPRPEPAPSWPDDNTDSGTYDSGDYYDSDSSDSGFSTGGMAILAVVVLAVSCTAMMCCRNAYNREEDLSRAMTSDGYVATYVDGTTLSSPGRVRGRPQANVVAGTVIHPTVHVHPRSSDQHPWAPDQHSNRTDPSARGFPLSESDPPPFAPSPSAPPAQNFYPPDPPEFAPPPSAPTSYPPPFAPPPSAPAPPNAPYPDEPPPYDVATMFPTVHSQNP